MPIFFKNPDLERLNDFLRKVDLSVLHKYIAEHGEAVKYRRGDIICREGEVCPLIGIIKEGYFQYSVINSNGENCITGFSLEGDIVTDYIGSFLNGKPAFTSITAGCNSTVVQVRVKQARAFISENHPQLISDVSSFLLAEAYRRYIDLHTKTAKERYIELSARCHGDLSMIPLQEIASYLSISRRQLQRIRESFV